MSSMILAQGHLSEEPLDPNPVVFRHVQLDPFTCQPISVLQEIRRINIGDMVLMEYKPNQLITVVVEEILDGQVYGTDHDGQSYEAPLADCDKVPF